MVGSREAIHIDHGQDICIDSYYYRCTSVCAVPFEVDIMRLKDLLTPPVEYFDTEVYPGFLIAIDLPVVIDTVVIWREGIRHVYLMLRIDCDGRIAGGYTAAVTYRLYYVLCSLSRSSIRVRAVCTTQTRHGCPCILNITGTIADSVYPQLDEISLIDRGSIRYYPYRQGIVIDDHKLSVDRTSS